MCCLSLPAVQERNSGEEPPSDRKGIPELCHDQAEPAAELHQHLADPAVAFDSDAHNPGQGLATVDRSLIVSCMVKLQ